MEKKFRGRPRDKEFDMVYKGSKARLLPKILPVIQGMIDLKRPSMYIEPFVGGANVITEVRHEKRHGSDINRNLIDFLMYAKVDPSLSWCPDTVSAETYRKVREDFKRAGAQLYSRRMHLAVGWLASYGGRFFDGGYAGETKGNRKPRYIECKENMKRHAPRLEDVNLGVCDFVSYDPDVYSNALFYCDPPYRDTVGYGVDFPFDRFYDWCRKMARNNWVLVSEFKMPDDFKVVLEIPRKVTLDSNRVKAKSVKERLFYVGKDDWSDILINGDGDGQD